jgi:NAD(P)-dependent dehydrogenase (short-subunit alcohol dehydrogenase family)
MTSPQSPRPNRDDGVDAREGNPDARPGVMNSLPDGYRAVVVGASGAIGSALVQALQADARCASVQGLSRRGDPVLDLCEEASIATAAERLRAGGPVHLLLCATGVLQVDGRAPEKRLAELDAATMARALAVNAVGPALLIKHFHGLLPLRERALLGVLSARVGSIGDNRLGGWYSYRASKAALNMLLRTAAVEVARQRPLAVLAALHPGTVRSPLSAPIIGGAAAAAASPAEAARRLLSVLDALPAEGASGSFHAWDGAPVPW